MSKQTDALKLAVEALVQMESALARCFGPHKAEEGDRHRALATARANITAIREALALDTVPLAEQSRLLSAAPCDQCGYNGPGYYQPDTHPCAAKHHQALAEQPAQQQEPDRSCNDAYELIMGWADIYAAQTGRIYSEAAQDPSKTARMADERTMLACVVAQTLSQPAQQQEPVAQWQKKHEHPEAEWENTNEADAKGHRDNAQRWGWKIRALYTSPPASKPWVGLTDEEIHKMTVLMGINPEWKAEMEIVRSVVRNLEAKLREKNGG